MRELLINKLNWKIFPVTELTGVITTEFLGDEFTLLYEVEEGEGNDKVSLEELVEIGILDAKQRIVTDIITILLNSIDKVESIIYLEFDEEGNLQTKEIKAEVTKS